MTAPLMPKATAVWLVENTKLTFRQIAVFCDLHELEIQAMADGDVAYNIIGISPINNGQLALEEIEKCENDRTLNLVANILERNVKDRNKKAKKIISPSQRADKPAAILWVIKNYPEIMDSQICKLIGTTKLTIEKIRRGEIKDFSSLRPKSPIGIGLCDNRALESAINVSKAYQAKPKPKVAVKKAVVKKAVVKKAVVKKAVVKKAVVKKAVVKKAVVKKAVVKKAVVKKAVVKKPVAKKSK